jgi:phage gp36-like protein
VTPYLLCPQEGEQEPFDITVNWTKLTVLNYTEFEVDTVGGAIVRAIQDEEDLNWEIKVLLAVITTFCCLLTLYVDNEQNITDEQAVFLENALFVASEVNSSHSKFASPSGHHMICPLQETTESLRARYEEAVQPFQQNIDAEEEQAPDDDGSQEALADVDAQAANEAKEQTQEQGQQDANFQHRTERSSRVRSREPSQSRGQGAPQHYDHNGSLCTAAQRITYSDPLFSFSHCVDGYREPKRSRIPFDVTKMSYDQYCAKYVPQYC